MTFMSDLNWGLVVILIISLIFLFNAKKLVDEQEREQAEKKRSENG